MMSSMVSIERVGRGREGRGRIKTTHRRRQLKGHLAKWAPGRAGDGKDDDDVEHSHFDGDVCGPTMASTSSATPSSSSSRRDLNLAAEAADLDSSFSESEAGEDEIRERKQKRARRRDLASKPRPGRETKAAFSVFSSEAAREEGRRGRQHFLTLNAYDRHKQLVNEYFLYYRGATDNVMRRDTSRDKTDLDVVRENHRFLWDDAGDDKKDDAQLTWGQRLAKKYCSKLFKEYCICDLSRYKENAVAMRWRTESEVVSGKGQFACGSRKCPEKEGLRTWEVNFAYRDKGSEEKKNALVKVRLCPDCSYKINYHHRKREVTKKKQKRKKEKKKRRKRRDSDGSSSGTDEEVKEKKRRMEADREERRADKVASDIWSKPVEVEQERTREEDFSEYLEDLFL